MNEVIDKIIRNALAEDIGTGDITTSAVLNSKRKTSGKILIKEAGVLAGIDIAEKVFSIYDRSLSFDIKISNGSKVNPGDIAAIVSGNAASVLTAERTALNFLQRMSGIATLTSKFIEQVKHTKAKIIDTRKTAPGLRLPDKKAVKTGGGENHRFGLYDMFLIKDNHIETAGSITNAVKSCKLYNEKSGNRFKIEIETKNIDEVKEAINCNVDIIMLDNFDIRNMTEAVKLINGKCKVEASGGVTLQTVKSIAETGVDFISVGALTHSVKALDISLELLPE
ncbi:putative nicotinate-nucleotide pyrophosphorylase [carboxylating] [bacterium BMS3Abin03]|nr:putative nicotinate-nucleotide pyrophosphorylase [carboxylating] [bacterium BMS3Abin03]